MERPVDTLLSPDPMSSFFAPLHPPPQHPLSPCMGDTGQAHLTFISVGSKNPKIALKLAEFQTDRQGKVRGPESPEELWVRRGVRGAFGAGWVVGSISRPLTPFPRQVLLLAN